MADGDTEEVRTMKGEVLQFRKLGDDYFCTACGCMVALTITHADFHDSIRG